MATIELKGGFTVIPEGTHIFKITSVSYKEEFGKLEVNMETAKGQKHTERFTLMRQDGTTNEGAMGAFSFFARTAMNDSSLTFIDHNDIVGKYIKCVVNHDVKPSTKDPNKNVTFVHLGDKFPADGFEETVGKKQEKTNIDLKALLG
jgi:hypothetical protein